MQLRVEATSFTIALHDPELKRAALQVARRAYNQAHGLSKNDSTYECFGCGVVWTHDRIPVIFVAIIFIEEDTNAVGALCNECSTKEPSKIMVTALERDFDITVKDIQLSREWLQ
jgi:hypothetical protein